LGGRPLPHNTEMGIAGAEYNRQEKGPCHRLNQVWLSGITYIRIRTGFVYLAAILDAYSRKVIGYAVSTRLDTALTLEALRMAIARRRPNPGVIHHSDQGVQYASCLLNLSRHRPDERFPQSGHDFTVIAFDVTLITELGQLRVYG